MDTLSSSDFESLLATAFKNSFLQANSCGGADASRSTTASVPGVYRKTEVLPRLDSTLPAPVRAETMREEISYSDNPPVLRDANIRACVDNIRTHPWKGSIEGGRLKISAQFNSNLFIKTRKLIEKKTSGGWQTRFEWKEEIADRDVPDYFYVAPSLAVYLTPNVQGGALSYSQVEVKWSWVEDKGFVWPEHALVSDPFAKPHGHPLEKRLILDYKASVMKMLGDRISATFNDPSVRTHLSKALTSNVKSGDLANREIVEASGGKASIRITFK